MEALLKLIIWIAVLYIKVMIDLVVCVCELIGHLLSWLFGNEKSHPRPRPHGHRTPLVVIRSDRPFSAGHVSRNADGGGTYTGICFACHGTGIFPATRTTCRRCNGSGVYRKTWYYCGGHG